MIKTKFVFAVSMVAMLSCGVAWASAPSGSETVADGHDVYTEATNAGTSTATNLATGIAGVTYVNRMVNTAGNAAQRAEDHAAAAGAYAIQAETAAKEAKTALSGKLDNKFTAAANKNAIVTTNNDGTVTPVAISDDETKGTYITDVEVKDGVVTLSRGTPSDSDTKYTAGTGITITGTDNKINVDSTKVVMKTGQTVNSTMVTDNSGNVVAGQITKDSTNGQFVTGASVSDGNVVLATKNLASGDVTGALGYTPENVANKVGADNFTQGSTTQYTSVAAAEKIAANAVAASKAELGDLAVLDMVSSDEIDDDAVITDKIADLNVTEGKLAADSVTTAKIKDAAVTVAKTSGIFGYIPTSSNGTGSAQIWVE